LWDAGLGVSTSWTILILSKIASPNDYHRIDNGGHRFGFTASGILIDSSVRNAIQLQEGTPFSHKNIKYTIHGVENDTPTLQYNVSLFSYSLRILDIDTILT
jgi:hypothetical protein